MDNVLIEMILNLFINLLFYLSHLK